LDGFRLNTSELQWLQIDSSVKRLIDSIQQPIKDGDKLRIYWLSGGRIIFSLNGNVISELSNQLLADRLWSIWLGANSVVDAQALIKVVPLVNEQL
jgi:hypothetical protein